MAHPTKVAPPAATAGELTPRIFSDSLSELCPNSTFTPGSLEALRQCHSRFLELVASELAVTYSLGFNKNAILQPRHVQECMDRLGFTDIIEAVKSKGTVGGESSSSSLNETSESSKKRKNRKHKEKQEQEQEPLAKKKKKKAKSKQKFQITDEMIAEQERLLNQSKINAELQQQQY